MTISKILSFLLIFLSFQILAARVHTSWQQECYEFKDSESSEIKYCIARGENSSERELLYFFHGANGSEASWVDGHGATYRNQLQQLFDESSGTVPTVISVSLGKFWLLSNEGLSKRPLLKLENLHDQILQPLERKHFGQGIDKRSLMGVSMGGYNALRLALAYPSDWDAVALISPLNLQCDPHANQFRIAGCLTVNSSKENLLMASGAHLLVKKFFPDSNQWVLENPLKIVVDASKKLALPRFFLSSGEKDKFGFYEGTEEFASILLETQHDVTWSSTRLKHGGFVASELANFFQQ